jgi:hypothetical protein
MSYVVVKENMIDFSAARQIVAITRDYSDATRLAGEHTDACHCATVYDSLEACPSDCFAS